jgi:hypothetical protein
MSVQFVAAVFRLPFLLLCFCVFLFSRSLSLSSCLSFLSLFVTLFFLASLCFNHFLWINDAIVDSFIFDSQRSFFVRVDEADH